MRQHGRHDVGVVNLLSPRGNLSTQRHQILGHHGAVLKYLEATDQSAHVIESFPACDGSAAA